MLEQYLRERQRQRGMLLMTHIVVGHPDFDTSLRLVESMALAGVDLIELQIPFSEPIADGPVILRANQEALSAGSTVERCFTFGEEVAKRFDIPFLFMSYYNVLFKQGVARFVSRMHAVGLKGRDRAGLTAGGSGRLPEEPWPIDSSTPSSSTPPTPPTHGSPASPSTPAASSTASLAKA